MWLRMVGANHPKHQRFLMSWLFSVPTYAELMVRARGVTPYGPSQRRDLLREITTRGNTEDGNKP